MIPKDLRKLTSPDELGAYILDERARLASQRTLSGVGFMHAYSDVIDSVVNRVFDLSVQETNEALGHPVSDSLEGVSLIATGGYGRREMSPYSDIDVTFVVADEDNVEIDLLIKRAYRLLMDVLLNGAKLKVGYAYRQLPDCEDLPLETHTALLDARHVAGGTMLFDRFYAAVVRSVVPASFVLGHIEQRRAAGREWGESVYKVEPNIKEGVGGQRDLQTARWIAQVTFGVTRNDVWHALRSKGVVSDLELNWVEAATEFLAKMRNSLHLACDRGSNVITAERQEEIAAMRKFAQGSSVLMSRYYMHAERIAGLYRKIAAACCEQALEIEPGVIVKCGEIGITDRGLLPRDPAAAIRLFQHMAGFKLALSWSASDLLRDYLATSGSKRFVRAGRSGRLPSATTTAFLQVLSLPDAATALSCMARVGLLQALVPEFAKVMHLIPGDAAHELTVGAHSLEVVRQLGLSPTFGNDEIKDVYSSISEPEVLCLAALLHDIGKVDGTGGHAERGASMAASVGRRMGLRPDATALIDFLVRRHLVMSETARLRDLNDKRTVEDFVAVVDSQDKLDMLFLLTIADVRSVGQTTWSEVHMRFLQELYHRASSMLRGSGTGKIDIERHRGRLARELSLANIPKDEVDEHCRAMPAGYLLNTSPDDLALHIQFVRSARSGEPVVLLRDDITRRFTVITVCALDDPTPGLLARIAGALSALGVDIHAAQVFTRESHDRIAIDLIYVDFDRRTLPELKRMQVESELARILAEKPSVESVFARYGKRVPDGVAVSSLKVMSHLSDQHTVIEIEAEDQVGLLYRLTSAISSVGWDIHGARVSTWGTRARDAFYVTKSDGTKLDPSAAALLQKAITAGH